MTEDVILKNRTKRLEELDTRMEAEAQQSRARDQALAQLNSQLETAHAEKQQLMDEVAMRKEKLDAVQRENFGLKGEISKCDAIIGNEGDLAPSESFAAIAANLETAVTAEAELERLRGESSQQREMLEETQGLLDSTKNELEELRQATGDDATQLEVATKALEKSEETALAVQTDLENRIEGLTNDVNRTKLELDALKQVESTLKASIEKMNDQSKDHAQRLKDAVLKAEQATTEKNRMELEVKPLQQKLEPLEKQKDLLTNRVKALESTVEKLQSDLKSKVQQVEFFSEQVKTAEMKVGMTEEEADALVDKIIELEKKLEGRETMIRAVSDELVSTKQELAAKRQEVLELEAKLVTVAQVSNQQEEQLYTMNEKVEMAILEVRARDERLATMSGEVEVLQEALRESDVQLMGNYQKMKAFEDKVKTQMQINQNQVTKLSDIELERARMEATMKATQGRVEGLKKDNAEKTQKLKGAVEKTAQLQELVSTRNQQLSLTKQKMDFARQEARLKDEEAFQSRRELDESKVEMAQHMENLGPLRTRIEELKKVAADAKAQEKHIWLLNEKSSVMQQEIRASEEEAELSKKRQHLAEKQVSSLNDKVDELKRTTARLEAENSTLSKDKKRAQDEVNRFRASKELMQAMQMQQFYSAAADEPNVDEPRAVEVPEPAEAAAAATVEPEPTKEVAEEPSVGSEQTAAASAKLTEELEDLKSKLASAEASIVQQEQTNSVLQQDLEKAQEQMGMQEKDTEDTIKEYFNSTVLVVKMMLADNQQTAAEEVLYELADMSSFPPFRV